MNRQPCCATMADFLTEAERDYGTEGPLKLDPPQIGIPLGDGDGYGSHWVTWEEWKPIRFCPFCGTRLPGAPED